MNFHRKLVVTTALAALPFTVSAEDLASIVDRNGDQQRRIEQGLRTGDLTVQEAARLEGEASRIYRMESRALSDGNLSSAERARINSAQDRLSRDIVRERNDRETGNPNSASSLRMQADVQRNINQQERIEQGIRSGELTNREVSRLQYGQSGVTRIEARAGADGHIDRHEQRIIQGADNRQSRQIYAQRHDNQHRRGGDSRQAYGNHFGPQARQGGYNHAPAGNRHDGGLRNSPQQRAFAQHSYAQAGRRR